MNKSLEFHDSTVSIVRAVGADLIVSFSDAYVHYSLGEPGVSPGEGFSWSSRLRYGQACSATLLVPFHAAASPLTDSICLCCHCRLPPRRRSLRNWSLFLALYLRCRLHLPRVKLLAHRALSRAFLANNLFTTNGSGTH